MTENFSLEDFKKKFGENRKFRMTTIAMGVIVVLVLGFLSYRQWIWKPANEKSKETYFIALNSIANEGKNTLADTSKAVSKTDPIKKLQRSVKKYDGKIGGEVSKYILATQYMRKGKYKEALVLLENVHVDDTYVSVEVIGLQGDCESELKNYEKAYALYQDAARKNENDFTSPMYLFKAGLIAEKLKKPDEAKALYEKIATIYPKSFYAKEKNLDAYIARNSK
tara:strand:- start:2700 stop:3371 length:672 start_codon:yes stop_codon:yes gene_type:complete